MLSLYDVFPFFNDLTHAERELLMGNMKTVNYDAGKVLMEDGLSCVNAFFVLKGVIRVFKMSEDGREITLYRIRAGETCLMTVSCIMTDSEFQAVASVEEATELVIVPAATFKQLLSESAVFLHFIFEKTLVRLKDVMLVVEKVTFDSMKKRVALFLHDSFKNRNGNILLVTHEQIAFEVGTAREVVSRTLKELAKAKVVKLSRGAVEVTDTNALKEILVT